MKYIKYKKPLSINYISTLSISKLIFFIFLLYISWFKEIWGDVPIILYGSVFSLTVLLIIPDNEDHRHIGLDSVTDFFIVLLVFGIYCVVTGIIICSNRSLLISSMVTYFSYLIVFFDICVISERDNGWEWLLYSVLLVAIICCFYQLNYGVIRHNGGAEAQTLSIKNNPHTLSFTLLTGIFGLIANRKIGFDYSVLKLSIMLLLSYAILRTGSRKMLLATVMILDIWLFSMFRVNRTGTAGEKKLIFYLSILFAVFFVAWYISRYYVGTGQFARLMRLFSNEEDTSNEDRIRMYRLAWELWKTHPLFGVGFNQYQLYSWRGDYSHSVYAEVLACTGLIGSVILFIPIFGYFFSIMNQMIIAPQDQKYYYTVCFAGMLAMLFLGIGQIWVYGFAHELFFFCVFGAMEDCKKTITPTINEIKDKKRCKYLLYNQK